MGLTLFIQWAFPNTDTYPVLFDLQEEERRQPSTKGQCNIERKLVQNPSLTNHVWPSQGPRPNTGTHCAHSYSRAQEGGSEFSSQFYHSAAYRRFQHTFMISSKNIANLLKQRGWGLEGGL